MNFTALRNNRGVVCYQQETKSKLIFKKENYFHQLNHYLKKCCKIEL